MEVTSIQEVVLELLLLAIVLDEPLIFIKDFPSLPEYHTFVRLIFRNRLIVYVIIVVSEGRKDRYVVFKS